MKSLIKSKSFLLIVGLIALISLLVVIYSGNKESQKKLPTPTPTMQTLKVAPMSSSVKDTPVDGQIIVKFKPQFTDAQIAAHLQQYNASIIKKIEGINQTVVKVPAGQEVAIMQKLQQDGYVEQAQRDYTTHAFFTPNDTYFNLQWGLNNTGQTIQGNAGTAQADIRAERAWNVTQGNGVKVAILDTGINVSHPDLAGKIVAQKVFATSSIEDNNGHGTHVAGIIAADTNNSAGVAGVCPNCQLIIGKVMDDTGTGTTSNATAGITWAADQGAKVINMSLGTSETQTASLYQQAVDYAYQKGAIVIAAAGNNGVSDKFYPAAANNVVSVAATDNNDQKASFSNYGSWVQIAAPGKNIVSTLPNHSNAKGVQNYGYLSGTSMAGPFVAGTAALVASTSYGSTPQALINRLYTTADKINGTGTYWVNGRVNAAEAVGASAVSAAPSVVNPSYVCEGSNTGSVCPTTSVSPTITGNQTNPSTQPGTSVSPSTSLISEGPSVSPGTTGTPGGGGSTPNISFPCTDLSQATYNALYEQYINAARTPYKTHIKDADDAQTTIHHHGRHGHHWGHRGFFGRMFEWILKLIESLLKLIGDCVSNPPSTNIQPSVAPSTAVSPSVAPSASMEPRISSPVATSSSVIIVPPASSN